MLVTFSPEIPATPLLYLIFTKLRRIKRLLPQRPASLRRNMNYDPMVQLFGNKMLVFRFIGLSARNAVPTNSAQISAFKTTVDCIASSRFLALPTESSAAV